MGHNVSSIRYTKYKLYSESLVYVFALGTTWTQEMTWLLANNLNYQKAADVPLTERFPFLE